MAKFTEEQFNGWRYPPSDAESTKLENAEKMIRDAIAADPVLKKIAYEIYGQGSYANDTNVRLNSDIDINIRLSDVFYTQFPEGEGNEKYNYKDSDYTFSQYKQDVYNALVRHFGASEIERRDKCILVKGNTYRVEADVVPSLKYIVHFKDGSKRIGAKFISDSGNGHINYAKQHIDNGILKNQRTLRRFKRLVRIFKRLRYRMIAEGKAVSPNITSFLIESLLWNVPDSVYNNYDSWTERIKGAIIHLYEKTENESDCKEWGEVSECLYLFHSGRSWSVADVNAFMVDLWNYLEFS